MKKYRIMQDGYGEFIPQKRCMFFLWVNMRTPIGCTLNCTTLEEARSYIWAAIQRDQPSVEIERF